MKNTNQPDQDLKILCSGLHPGIIQAMLDYDYLCGADQPRIVGIIAGNRKTERFYWGESEISLPVYETVEQIAHDVRHSIRAAVNFQSGRRVLASTEELLAALPKLAYYSVFAEQVPETHALHLGKLLEDKHILATGPASVGLLLPGNLKLGAIGGISPDQLEAADIIQPGDVAVVSTSGGMVNELISSATNLGFGVSMAISLGGERYSFTTPAEAMQFAEKDKNTKTIIFFGELGGDDEYEIADLIKAGALTKNIVAYIAGEVAALFSEPTQFGHAKAMANTPSETAAAKKLALASQGVHVLESLSELPDAMKQTKSQTREKTAPSRKIGSRHKRLIVSHISGELKGETHVLGTELTDLVTESSFAQLVLGILLGKRVTSKKLVEFTDLTLRLLVDHGPYVSGATNTIVAARAGKDYVSSLVSGLLTIGPRFGGAVNGAAQCWLEGVNEDRSPREFTDGYAMAKKLIPGIGHKHYSTDTPDPRLPLLEKFSHSSNGDRYLVFARSVEKITVRKKRNLILNVDGTIAAILLDLLESELGYSREQLDALVDAEFFNAIFVISRTVGFSGHYFDQKRHDEGLLRLSDNEILYLPDSEI
jgi:ATP citrate (pro-S)-lyase